MANHYSEEFELPLALPRVADEPLGKEKIVGRTTSSPASLLNEDCLLEVFRHLALEPLMTSAKFDRTSSRSFLSISFQSHQNLTLLACCLVNKFWYRAARRALHYRLILPISQRDTWVNYLSSLADGEGRRWVQSAVLIGGGVKNSGSAPTSQVWELLPNLKEVEIFALGWSTGSLLCTEGLERAVKMGGLTGIRKLEITATSEYLLSDLPLGKNFLDVQHLLTHLPSLIHLSLRGFNYRLPISPDLDEPIYKLHDLTLEKCSLSLTAFRWLFGGSYATVVTLSLPNSSVWDDREGATAPATLPVDDEIEMMAKRLCVELPLFSMCKKT